MIESLIRSVYPSPFAGRMLQITAPISTTASDLLADAFRHLDATATTRLDYNFGLAFPQLTPAERRSLIKRHWRARFHSELERIQLNGMTGSQLTEYCRARVEIEGGDHLRTALEGRQSVVFFTPHYGSFIVAAMRLILDVEGRKTLSIFYDPPEVNPTTTMYKGIFDRLGCKAKVLYNDRTAVLKGLRALKNGNALTIMPDVYSYNMGMMFVPFFGRLAVAMGGAAFFALKANALLMPTYCWRRKRGRFVVQYGPPIEPARTGNFDEDVYLTTAKVFGDIERQLTDAPEHWVYWESLCDRFSFGGNVTLPQDSTSWESQLAKLCAELAEERSSLGSFLQAFRRRLSDEAEACNPTANRLRTGTG
jgi:KDO2-lipid IV(A) lauroyltransferase